MNHPVAETDGKQWLGFTGRDGAHWDGNISCNVRDRSLPFQSLVPVKNRHPSILLHESLVFLRVRKR